MRLLLIVGGVVALSAPAVAQDAPCDARPRWLVVTVVAGVFEPNEGEDDVVVSLGARIVDRCFIGSVSELSDEGPAKSFLRLRFRNGEETIAVAETVQQICAAVDDCADATQPSGGE